MTTVSSILAVYGAVCALATALAPFFPPGSKTAKVLNWIGSQLRKE
jgi:hypothetical protein